MPDLDTSLRYCTYCPKLCRHTCPVSNAEPRETIIPQAKMAQMYQLRIGRTEPSEEAASSLYACSGCGACTEACLHRVEPGRHLFSGRATAQAAGHGHPSLADLPERTRAHAERAAAETRAKIPAERRPAEAEVALLPACDDTDATAAMLALAGRVGADYLAVADVSIGCGGYPLLAGGYPERFRLHAEALARELQGYARLVVACPACAWAMSVEYPAHGVRLRPRVESHVAFLAEFGARIPEVAATGEAYYHDPCYLGRHLGLYDPPRQLLGKVLARVREFSHAREESECSGGGGVLPLTMPETADAIASHRLIEVRESGAPLVTACATCKKRLTRDGVKAMDLVELLEERTRPA